MDKNEILDAMRDYAARNDGKTPGINVLKRMGIPENVWRKYWPRISDAHLEAGLDRNDFVGRFDEQVVLERYCQLAQELGRIPIDWDLNQKRKSDKSFPVVHVFRNHFGSKTNLVAAVADYCKSRNEYDDVLEFCRTQIKRVKPTSRIPPAVVATGYVYLIKWPRYYKVGHTERKEKRPKELGLKIPDMQKVVHWIETDDPTGVEVYWKARWDEKRIRGTKEFFKLTAEDVAAFKRWKKIA